MVEEREKFIFAELKLNMVLDCSVNSGVALLSSNSSSDFTMSRKYFVAITEEYSNQETIELATEE